MLSLSLSLTLSLSWFFEIEEPVSHSFVDVTPFSVHQLEIVSNPHCVSGFGSAQFVDTIEAHTTQFLGKQSVVLGLFHQVQGLGLN